jgi:hypothetical protein
MYKFNNTYFNYTNSSMTDGFHTAFFSCNDTENNFGTASSINFQIRTQPPVINYEQANATTFNTGTSNIEYIPYGVGSTLDSCDFWLGELGSALLLNNTDYSIFDGVVNTFAFNLLDGKYQYAVSCNNTANARNFGSQGNYTFITDTINPYPKIVYPANNTVYDVMPNYLDFMSNDSNPDTCQYSLDNGAVNTTTSCDANITGLSAPEGINKWLIIVNDTAGHNNYIMAYFNYTHPTGGAGNLILILYPIDGDTYTTAESVADLNYSIVAGTDGTTMDSCWYSTNGGQTNSSKVFGCTNFTGITAIIGSNTRTVYGNDSLNRLIQDSITFTFSSGVCNLTDVAMSFWSYTGGKFIDGFSDEICSIAPKDSIYGEEVWNYSYGRFVDGIGSSPPNSFPYVLDINGCNMTDIAISVWCYENKYINGIGSGGHTKVSDNSTMGQYIWQWIATRKYVNGVVG